MYDVSPGRPSAVKLFKRTFKSAKNFKSPPTAKSTGRGTRDLKVKQNLHRTAKARSQVGHSRSRKKTGYRAWTQLKFRNSRSVHVYYLPKQNKKRRRRGRKREREIQREKEKERERKNEKTFAGLSRWPIIIYPSVLQIHVAQSPVLLAKLFALVARINWVV